MTDREQEDQMNQMAHAQERMDRAVHISKQSAKDALSVALDSIVVTNAVSRAVHELLDRLIARNKIHEDR